LAPQQRKANIKGNIDEGLINGGMIIGLVLLYIIFWLNENPPSI